MKPLPANPLWHSRGEEKLNNIHHFFPRLQTCEIGTLSAIDLTHSVTVLISRSSLLIMLPLRLSFVSCAFQLIMPNFERSVLGDVDVAQSQAKDTYVARGPRSRTPTRVGIKEDDVFATKELKLENEDDLKEEQQ